MLTGQQKTHTHKVKRNADVNRTTENTHKVKKTADVNRTTENTHKVKKTADVNRTTENTDKVKRNADVNRTTENTHKVKRVHFAFPGVSRHYTDPLCFISQVTAMRPSCATCWSVRSVGSCWAWPTCTTGRRPMTPLRTATWSVSSFWWKRASVSIYPTRYVTVYPSLSTLSTRHYLPDQVGHCLPVTIYPTR